jgi:protein-S-isoprenylcysteine O-methyltransferase Ste14
MSDGGIVEARDRSGQSPSLEELRQQPPAWARSLQRLTHWLILENEVGGRPWKLAWVINVQKGGTLPFLLLLMWFYGNTSPAVWVYVALHGSYGLAWLIKDAAFPDASWQRRVSVLGSLMAFGTVLGWYWVFGWLLVSGVSQPAYPLPDAAWFALCITLHTIGVVVMIAADTQKHFTLKYRPGLITTGMFRYVRHPNYLGEMIIYGSYALMVWHWLPPVVLAWVWVGVFTVNMMHKEASMSRHPEWTAYRQRTGWLLPRVVRGT